MAAIDLNTVRSIIEGRLATELASSPAVPVIFNNMAFDSTTEDTFVQCLTSFEQQVINTVRKATFKEKKTLNFLHLLTLEI